MTKRRHTKLVHEGNYIAEVDIEIVDSDEGWGPYLSLEDALKLDDVREALKHEEIDFAASIARVFRMSPVKVA